MRFDGIIFDFNGTLLWDMDLHDRIWNDLSMDLRGYRFTAEEFARNVHGHTNREIFPYVMGRHLGGEECDRLSEQKEQRYRDLLCSLPERKVLVPGAEALFERCREAGIAMAIATAAGRSNVEFYIEAFDLHRWFRPETIVFDDGTLPGKPDPALYALAMGRLGLSPEACIVVEDAPLGIQSALAAGSKRIIGIYADEAGRAKLESLPLYRRIHTYHEMGMEDFGLCPDSFQSDPAPLHC